jgi:hypothetical protein
MKLFICITALLMSTSNYAQEVLEKTQKCNCKEVLTEVINKVETNYLKYKELETEGNLKAYNKQKSIFKQVAPLISSSNCAEFIGFFLKQFKDGHLYVFEIPKYSETEILENKRIINSFKINKDSLSKTLKNQIYLIASRDQIIGKYSDGKSNITVIKSNKNYKAYSDFVTDETNSNKIIAEFSYKEDHYYSGTYYGYKNKPRFINGSLYKDFTVLSMGAIVWAKLNEGSKMNSVKQNPILPTIKNINSETLLITIPSFIVDYQFFLKLLAENDKAFKKCKTLIVDIRGNRGGNAIYFPLIERFANRNTVSGSQGKVLASLDTKLYFESMIRYSEAIYKPVVERIEKNLGEIVDGPKYTDIALDKIENSIENIAILTDGACASAAESFILHSKKANGSIVTFGSPTEGMIDYTSVNSSVLKTSMQQNIYFGYPTSSLGYADEKHPNGYNEKGIFPDVPINNAVQNKIKFIIEYYSK